MQNKRQCGMLLPISALPSRYGIGAFTKEAYTFVDQLKKAGQSCWQILPLGPTGYGDSPYQSFSAFAGNPYFISLEDLTEDGLLTKEECDRADFGSAPTDIDYEKLYRQRFPLLKRAFGRWLEKKGTPEGTALEHFFEIQLGEQTREYCFYMALKDEFEGKSWLEWEEDIRLREPAAMKKYRKKLQNEILFYEFLQYLFEQQWTKLRKYANEQGIRIVGDIPIYVALDSADSWAHPELFQFDEDCKPKAVAGCPPDAFAKTGQLWGNPLYRWDYHKKTDFAWWMERMAYSFGLYDVVRIDHFRGFDEYYSIPAEDETAEFGHWEPGPGYAFFAKAQEVFGEPDIIAEDLGFLTPSVRELVKKTGYPGMKVLEFAFYGDPACEYLPHTYQENCVVYTGTHDNDTLKSWYQTMSDYDRGFSEEYLGNSHTPWKERHWDFIRAALSSVARLAVIPVQDYLGLDGSARMNEPSTLGKNWRWRLRPDQINEELLHRCCRLAEIYGRI